MLEVSDKTKLMKQLGCGWSLNGSRLLKRTATKFLWWYRMRWKEVGHLSYIDQDNVWKFSVIVHDEWIAEEIAELAPDVRVVV